VVARVEGGEPGFVPPLREVVRREVAGGAVPGGAIQPFLVGRGGPPVGRVAAIVNPRLADDGAPLGQVGYFACADDREAARALFEAAFAWLRARRVRRVLGPMNGGAHLAHRLLVSGFERTPFLLEPRNPPWYPALLEAAGFAPIHHWKTWEIERGAFAPLRDRLLAIGRRGGRGSRVVWLDTAGDPAGSLSRVHGLLDPAWSGHVGWAPITLAELGATFGALLPLLPPHHVGVLVDGASRDLGFGLMFPDWIDEVRKLGGDASGWGRWMGAARANRVVAHTVAMVPEARGFAAGALLVAAGLDSAAAQGYRSLVFPLTTETFHFWEHVLPPATREYALYGREI
jgi:GNAT superfamily N-acetyltransferase